MAILEYLHQPLGQEVEAIAGRYVLAKELRLPFSGREVLCLIGHAAFDTACCGAGGCGYAVVPGYILKWKVRRSTSGKEISEVEPVEEEETQREIEIFLKKQENLHQVHFG
jgi:hypothetical protein